MPSTRLGKRKVPVVQDILSDISNLSRSTTSSEPSPKTKKVVRIASKKHNDENVEVRSRKTRATKGKNVNVDEKVTLFKSTPGKQKTGRKVEQDKKRNEPTAVLKPILKVPEQKQEQKKQIVLHSDLDQTTYTLVNDFGFGDTSFRSPSLKRPTATNLTEFDPSKPFRLALYVQAIVKNFNTTRQAVNWSLNKTMNQTSVVDVRTKTTLKEGKKPRNKKAVVASKPKPEMVQKKITDMVTVASKPATRKGNKTAAFKSFFNESANTSSAFEDEKDLSVNSKPSRRSYEVKFKDKEDVAEEPSTEQVLSELRKKTTKARPKKQKKDDKEYENWARSMNSAFDDIDKFELTVIE